jgi:hypothetical protein
VMRRTVFPRPSSSSSTLPFLSPVGGAGTRKGQNPNVGWLAKGGPGPGVK